MESARVHPDTSAAPTSRIRGLVQLLLTKLDLASDHIEDVGDAFQSEDAYRALTIHARLQKAWSDAYVAILVMEQLSGCSETHARNALSQSHRSARVPLALAWSLISRLPAAHHHIEPRLMKPEDRHERTHRHDRPQHERRSATEESR
jgi:hypothetical protein